MVWRFLDAMWPLGQCPGAVESSETYLLGWATAPAFLVRHLPVQLPLQRAKPNTEFAIGENMQLGDDQGLNFPSVCDCPLQFTAEDCTLFHSRALGEELAAPLDEVLHTRKEKLQLHAERGASFLQQRPHQ